MELSRRKFLRASTGAGASVLFGGTLIGGRFLQQANARTHLAQSLIDEATPILTEQAHRELRTIPEACREQIRLHFHEACLNVASFVTKICSTEFQDRLEALDDASAREQLFVVTFGEKVVPHAEIVRWVRTIAEETAAELRANWEDSSTRLARRWTLSLKSFEHGVSAEPFLEEMDKTIRLGIDESRRTAYPLAGQSPLLSAGGSKAPLAVEEAAMLRVNVRQYRGQGPEFVPVFVWNALTDVFAFFTGTSIQDPAVYHRAISERLALLGNRVGSEFETEVRHRLSDLHTWQEQAVAAAARQRADTLVPTFI
ncbi:MAG: twin-arginine translocation signal domain-containing protein [Pirellulales bacterium]|nr:twin-arginine translocation signal domain-containing protein [Pirellulales bacterium]